MFTIEEPTVAVTSVTVSPTTATLTVGGTQTLTATVAPDNATDKKVKWSVSGSGVRLYSDEACTTEVGANATDKLTVYAKGISAGSATITATSNADSSKSASCDVTVNEALPAHTHDGVTFEPWASADSLPTGGNYYLTKDVTIGSTWSAPSGTVNLCLNGHGIQYTDSSGSVINVGNGSKLNLYDCDTTTEHNYTVNNGLAVVGNGAETFTGGYITGGKGTTSGDYTCGGGVYVLNGGAFTMKNGAIIGNTASRGGGVNVASGGTFNMNGGAIQYNKATNNYGGGVADLGTVNLSDGVISHNTARYGAGVYIASGNTLNMSGGIVSENVAEMSGGGVHVKGTFDLSAGTISNNKAAASGNGGGVFVEGGTVKLSGNPTITGNTKGDTDGNVYLPSGRKITINGPLTNTTPVGVTLASGSGVFTTGLYGNGNLDNFVNENGTDYTLSLTADGEAQFHKHSFTYSATDNVITATCTTDGCNITTGLTLTISAPTGDLTADGSKTFPATLNDNYNTTAFPAGSISEISYTKDGADFTGTPTEAGAYVASVTVGTGDGAATASVSYTIAPKENAVAATVTANNRTYDGTEQPLVTVTGEATGGEMQYALGNETEATEQYTTSIPTATDAGTYYVWYKVEGDADHSDTTPVCITVTLAAPTTPIITGYALELGGVLGLRYYMALPTGTDIDYTDAKMTFTMNQREAQEIPYSQLMTDAQGKYFTCGVYVYQMADEITATFTYKKDGETQILTDTYSVKQYLDSLKGSEYSGAALNLVNATRAYGHFIQPYLARVNGWTVGGKYAELDYTGAVNVDAALAGSEAKKFTLNSMDSAYVQAAYYRLLLNADTSFIVEVSLKNTPAGTVSMTIDGTEAAPTVSGTAYRVTVPNIAANNLAVPHQVVMKIGSTTVFDFIASPMSYVYTVLSKSSPVEDEQNALAALYEYWQAAAAYNSQN